MKIVRHPQETSGSLVATIGMFDGVHRGHLSLIQAVQTEANRTGRASAIVTFKNHPREIIYPECKTPLLTSFEERMARLSQTGIDTAIVLDFTDKTAHLSARDFLSFLTTRYNVKGLIVGYDHRFGHNRSEGFEQYCTYAKEFHMEIRQASPYLIDNDAVSSSAIRDALSAGNIKRANAMLGYRYTLAGNVIDGHQLGRTLGFPTANLQPDDNRKLLPAVGVYAVMATLPDGSKYGGMMNIGQRPTVSGDDDISVETHLFGFNGNLYGKHLSIDLIDFMRSEQKYASIDDLRKHLQQDASTARRLLQECG